MQVKRHRTNTSVGLGQFKCEGDALNDATCRYIAGDIKGHEGTPNIFVLALVISTPEKKFASSVAHTSVALLIQRVVFGGV